MPEPERLFEPPPAQPRQGHLREGDRDLYRPARRGSIMYDRARNIATRAKLHAHLEERVPALTNQRTGNTKAAWGRARSAFADDWVSLAQFTNLVTPGKPRKTTHAKKKPREDAACTCLRQFLEGTDQPDYLLLGIEATIANRTGEPDPPGMQRHQGVLV